MKEIVREKTELLKRCRMPLLVLLLGLALVLLPTESPQETEGEPPEAFDRLLLQEEMEQILCRIDGVGKLTLMLMVDGDARQELAADISGSAEEYAREEKRQTVILSAGGGREEVVVTQSSYPRFTGALVVCEGAHSAAVRYDVTAAVSVLTGLSSNQISVVQGTG